MLNFILTGRSLQPKSVVKKINSALSSRIQVTENSRAGFLKERYDACIVHRARFAVESLICLGLMDLITEEYGKQFFLKSEQ